MSQLRIFFSVILSFLSVAVVAQQNYFAYFQSNDGQPFQLLYKSKSISSSTNGYAILPLLTNGEHYVTFRFASNTFPETSFKINIENKDQGFKIIKTSESLSLFNLISFDQIASISKEDTEIIAVKNKLDEPKTTTAKITRPTDDEKPTTITQTKPIPKEPTQGIKPAIPAEPVAEPIALPQTFINSTLLDGTEEGQFHQYIVSEKDFADTITIFVPIEKKVEIKNKVKPKEDETEPIKEEKNISSTVEPEFLNNIQTPDPNKSTPAQEKQIATQPNNNDKTASAEPSSEPQLKKVKLINSDCKKIADNGDLISLRVKLASQDDVKEMLKIAQKSFKQKCYTTEQIRKLSVLFITDDDKMNFFISAYPFVYDSEDFQELHTQFKTEEYIQKFKKMVSKQ